MLLGIAIGVVIMVLLILAYMVGYGMAAQRYNTNQEEE